MSNKKLKSPLIRAETLETIAKMERRGHTQQQMCIATGLSGGTVFTLVKEYRERCLANMMTERQEVIGLKLEQYREVRAAAWDAYERSMEDASKEVNEFAKARKNEEDGPSIFDPSLKGRRSKKSKRDMTTTESLERVKQIVTREGRLPNSAYLNIILQTHQAERDLLGLDELKPLAGAVAVVDWMTLLAGLNGQVPTVEARLVQALPAEPVDVPVNSKNGAAVPLSFQLPEGA